MMTASNPLISIVLPNLNTRQHLLEFLDSLSRQTYPKSSLEVVVVDNGSQDGSQAAMRDWIASQETVNWHHLLLVEMPRNMGIAVAYNEALKHCSDQNFAVVRGESDVLWEPDVLEVLVSDLLDDERAGIVGARGVDATHPERIDHAARYLNWYTGALVDVDAPELAACDAVFGSTFIIRRSCLDRLGYFFAGDRFLASELEFSVRAARLGYRVLFEPKAQVYHKIGKTTGRMNSVKFQYIDNKESVLFHLRYNPLPSKVVYLLVNFLYCLKRWLQGQPMPLRGYLDGVISGLTGVRTVPPGWDARAHALISDWLASA